METNVKLIDQVTFEATSGTGHSIVIDGPIEAGGNNRGPRPMEMLLMGLGSCTAYDVATILRKSRQEISELSLSIEATRSEMDPKVFTSIHIQFDLKGRQLKEKQVERAISLSAEKYCSASIMLGKTAEITHGFSITDIAT